MCPICVSIAIVYAAATLQGGRLLRTFGRKRRERANAAEWRLEAP